MARQARAARTLEHQVREALNRKQGSKADLDAMTSVGEPDGFGVVRTVRFDTTASKLLIKVLDLEDPRIEGVANVGTKAKPILELTFVHTSAADSRDPFDLSSENDDLEPDETEVAE